MQQAEAHDPKRVKAILKQKFYPNFFMEYCYSCYSNCTITELLCTFLELFSRVYCSAVSTWYQKHGMKKSWF